MYRFCGERRACSAQPRFTGALRGKRVYPLSSSYLAMEALEHATECGRCHKDANAQSPWPHAGTGIGGLMLQTQVSRSRQLCSVARRIRPTGLAPNDSDVQMTEKKRPIADDRGAEGEPEHAEMLAPNPRQGKTWNRHLKPVRDR
jgi:hypothetical protein